MISVIKTLKKENEFLKGKCENSDIALVKLIEEVWVHHKSSLNQSYRPELSITITFMVE
jgi:hypothetical protein